MILYAYHAFIPAKGAKTHQKGFHSTKEANMIDERVEFGTTIKQKKVLKATYVIDLVNAKCIKNRYRYDPDNPVSDDDAIRYFVNEYEKEIVEELRKMK